MKKLSINSATVKKKKERIEELYTTGIHDRKKIAQSAHTKLEIVDAVLDEFLKEERAVDQILAQQRIYAENEKNSSRVETVDIVVKEPKEDSKMTFITSIDAPKHSYADISVSEEQPVDMYEYMPVGLVDNRHTFPRTVHWFIFDTLNDNDLSNFQYQEEEVDAFITKHIPFENGTAKKGLKVYVSGLQSTLTSLFKVCLNRKVNLIVMHYNPNTQKYVGQDVLIGLDHNDPVPASMVKLLYNVRKASTYHCQLNELDANDKFYDVEFVKQGMARTWWERKKIFCKSMEDAYNVFMQYSMNVVKIQKANSETEYQLFVHENRRNMNTNEYADPWAIKTLQKAYF